ncbi:Fur-regulated basic protein FbpA [Anoxybacillus kestanbolensis]|uniref:Fur-regulated basic protein FbpA n=1 Tax=Anoxybacillus kestanbolensis TaxID=227476 RepID=UPI00208DAEBD|nr:Fur-regulated basic protein FbpA [Anoxybacillus kestanbolensis]MCL9969577.1 Fur-regulated basic protein FbpA [Anoxybacillus kestanbolensis]
MTKTFKSYLREAIENVKGKRIEQLIQMGRVKMEDGRQLYDLTISELEHEYRCMKEKALRIR